MFVCWLLLAMGAWYEPIVCPPLAQVHHGLNCKLKLCTSLLSCWAFGFRYLLPQFVCTCFMHCVFETCKRKTMMHGGEADEWNGNPEMHYFGMVGFDCGFNYVAFSAGTVSPCLMTSHDVLIPLFDAFHPRRHHHMELPNW